MVLNSEDEKYARNNSINHEYGHYLQEEEMGTLGYFFKVAIPSVILNVLSRFDDDIAENYYNYPWEADADERGGVIRY